MFFFLKKGVVEIPQERSSKLNNLAHIERLEGSERNPRTNKYVGVEVVPVLVTKPWNLVSTPKSKSFKCVLTTCGN